MWANDDHIACSIQKGDRDKGYRWREVTAIERTDEAMHWSKVGSEDRKPVAWYTNVTLEGTDTFRVGGSSMLRRQYIMDQEVATDFQRRIIKALPRDEWLAALIATTHHYARQSAT